MNTPITATSKNLPLIQPVDPLKEAELRLQEVAQKAFLAFCDSYALKSPKEDRVAALISFDDLSNLPKKSVQIFNAIHTLVKKEYRARQYINSQFPLPPESENTYCIPRSLQNELADFSVKYADKYQEYIKLYYPQQGVLLLEPKYQSYLDMGDVQEFAAIFNKSFRDIKTMRKVALQKIADFKAMAYKENFDQTLPEIDPQEVPRARQRLFEMFKYCEDYDVKKASLIELTDLIETDSLTSENLGGIVILHQDMEDYLKDNIEKIQGRLIHIVIETYAKILSLILLYSPKKIILDENTKLATKSRLEDLSKLNISDDKEAEYWRSYAVNCLDLLNTTVKNEEKWLKIAGAFAMSAVTVTATAYFSPNNLIDAIQQSYKAIKKALQDNTSTMPPWLPPVVMINRYCQKTMNNHADFKKIIHTLRKFKHIAIQEVRYGIIVTLERVALKTRVISIEIEAMKLLLQYVNIHDEDIAFRLVKALGRLLKNSKKTELSNTTYLLMTLLEETKAIHGAANLEKLHRKLVKFKEEHPAIDKRSHLPLHTYLIKYFLKEHGFIDDFGGRPASFMAVSSLHSTNLKFQTNHAALLKRIDQIVKITEVDVYGHTLYHAAVWKKNYAMINVIKKSGLNVDLSAQEYEEGNTALHLAVKLQLQETVEALLNEAPKSLLKIKNREGDTPLHLAAAGTPAILALLLQSEPHPSPVNKCGQTPILIAIEKDLSENAALLMKELLRLDMKFEANSALYQAIEHKKYETLKRLILLMKKLDYKVALKIILMMADEHRQLKCSADFARFHSDNIQNNADYRESFELFANYPQPCHGKIEGEWPKLDPPQIIKHMKNLELSQINFDVPDIEKILNIGDEFGNTALIYAAYYQEMAQFIPKIVQCGGKINHVNHLGLAPLHIAVIRENSEAVRQLLLNGAEIDLESGKFTPLHMAAYTLNGEIAQLLLSKGADPNKQTHYGDGALHMACLFNLEKNLRVPDISLVKNYDASPNTSPVVKPKSLRDLRRAAAYQSVRIDESSLNEKELEKIYPLILNILSLKKAIIGLEADEKAKKDLNQIFDTMQEDFLYTVPALESFEKRLKIIHILIMLFKFPSIDISKKDFFGNNILHLAALHCCPTIPKIICYYQPELYWKDNYDQLLPIECPCDPERVFAIFNAMNINYRSLDWKGQNGDEVKNNYLKMLADAFDAKTTLHLPLRHIFAKYNLFDLFERLVRLDPERATKQDHSFFKQTSLHVAARHGHEQILQICINMEKEKKISFLKQRDHFNNTAGHIAIIKSKHSFAKKFAAFGVEEVQAKNDDGRTMLHLAAIRGHKETVETLIGLKADPLESDAHGDIPLHLACMHAHPQVVALLLEKKPESIDALDEEGRAPLHHAAMIFFNGGQAKPMMGLSKADCEDTARDSLAVIKILREKQADLDISDAEDVTPLMIAADNGFEESVSMLLGNDIKNWRSSDILAQDINQRTALHMATIKKHVKVIELLLQHDQISNRGRAPPLYTSADINNETPLLSLAKKLTLQDDEDAALDEILNLYIKYGADLMEEDENGSTLLHWVCRNGVGSLARHLIAQSGRHLRKENNNGDTPLHEAAAMGHLATARLLIGSGAEAGPQNGFKATPLMQSVKNGHIELARYFLTLPIDLTVFDRQERNFLHYFLQEKSELNESEKSLLEDAIRRNPKLIRKRDLLEGNTPLHLAGRNGNADVLEVVLSQYPYRDILVIMGKKNNHDRDPKQEFEGSKRKILQPGKQNFKDIWLSIKPEEILSHRPRGIHEFISRNSLHTHHSHRHRKVAPRQNGGVISVPPPQRSRWSSCFDCFRFRRVTVVVPDDDGSTDD